MTAIASIFACSAPWYEILPAFGQNHTQTPRWPYTASVPESPLSDLVGRVSGTAGLSESDAERVIAEVLDHLSEPVDRYVVRRHRELHARGLTNDRIWPALSEEITQRRFPAAELSHRQLRRIVYG